MEKEVKKRIKVFFYLTFSSSNQDIEKDINDWLGEKEDSENFKIINILQSECAENITITFFYEENCEL